MNDETGGDIFDQALSDPALASIVHGYDSGDDDELMDAVLADGTYMTAAEMDAELAYHSRRLRARMDEQDKPQPATWRTTVAVLGLAVLGCGVWFGGGVLLGWFLWS